MQGKISLVFEQTRYEAFMFETDDDLQSLERIYFIGEPQISQKNIPDAQNNLLGTFATLYKIAERLEKEKGIKLTSPTP
jgi:hypothetical protein